MNECIEVLNLMSSGDVYQKPFVDIEEYCKKYSHSQSKTGKSLRDPITKIAKPAIGGVTRMELGNLLEKLKKNILNTINIQLDTLKIKRKQEDANASLAIFSSCCRKRHPKKECLVNVIEVCGICTEDHPTEICPSLPGLRAIYKGGVEPQDTLYPPKRLWRKQNPNIVLDPSMQYPQQQ